MTKEVLKIAAKADTFGRPGAEKVLMGCNSFLWGAGREKGIECYTKEGERCDRTLDFLCGQRCA